MVENLILSTMEQWIAKISELAEMAKLTALISEKTFLMPIGTSCVRQK